MSVVVWVSMTAHQPDQSMVQSTLRGLLERRRIARLGVPLADRHCRRSLAQEHQAANLIQARFRGYLARRAARRNLKAVVCIQSACRGRRARLLLKQTKVSMPSRVANVLRHNNICHLGTFARLQYCMMFSAIMSGMQQGLHTAYQLV